MEYTRILPRSVPDGYVSDFDIEFRQFYVWFFCPGFCSG